MDTIAIISVLIFLLQNSSSPVSMKRSTIVAPKNGIAKNNTIVSPLLKKSIVRIDNTAIHTIFFFSLNKCSESISIFLYTERAIITNKRPRL